MLLRRSDGCFLFIKRTDTLQHSDVEHAWDIPGGRIEPHESLIQALAREIKEEIGSDIAGTPTLINAQDIFVPAKNLHVVRLTYLLDFEPQSITLSDEHQEHTWLSAGDALQTHVEPFLKETLETKIL